MNKAGIIILDGPDGTGKTTLANYYIKKYNAKYLHLTYRWVNNMFEYNTAAIELAAKWANEGHLVIIDRLWMSNNVYDKAFRETVKSPFLGRFIDRLVLRYGGQYIVCVPYKSREYLDHYETLKTLRTEMYSTMLKVYDEYERLWNQIELEKWPHAHRYCLFTEGSDPEGFADSILEKAVAARQDGYMLDPANKSWSGSLEHGEILFINEQTTLRKGKPWYPRHEQTKGTMHLTSTIALLAGIPEYKIMWTDVDNGPWKEITSKYDVYPVTLGVGAYRKIVKDAEHYHFYGKPDNHITPEQDIDSSYNTTFMQRLIHQLNRYIGEYK